MVEPFRLLKAAVDLLSIFFVVLSVLFSTLAQWTCFNSLFYREIPLSCRKYRSSSRSIFARNQIEMSGRSTSFEPNLPREREHVAKNFNKNMSETRFFVCLLKNSVIRGLNRFKMMDDTCEPGNKMAILCGCIEYTHRFR